MERRITNKIKKGADWFADFIPPVNLARYLLEVSLMKKTIERRRGWGEGGIFSGENLYQGYLAISNGLVIMEIIRGFPVTNNLVGYTKILVDYLT